MPDYLHPDIPDAQRHYPKGFEPASNNTHPRKNEFGEYEWGASASEGIIRDPVIGRVDSADAPPTEVSGDRYIIQDYGDGAVNAAWDGAANNDIVQFDGSVWISDTPTIPTLVYVEDESDWWHFVDPNVVGGEWRNLNNACIYYKRSNLITIGAVVVETDMHTHTVPEGTLNKDHTVELLAWGNISSGVAQTNRIRFYFGATVVVDSGAIVDDGIWYIRAFVNFESATAQNSVGQLQVNNGLVTLLENVQLAAPAENVNTNFTIRVTGLKSNTANTINQQGMIIKCVEK